MEANLKHKTDNCNTGFVELCSWRKFDVAGAPRCGVPVRQDGRDVVNRP